MAEELENPFSVTKATEFSDLQINEYWVDFNFNKNESFEGLLNPNEYLPKYILGGKGCGKTHILRYYSYALQKIKNNNDISKLLTNNQYIGIYTVLDGLNSSRFQEKGISDDEWQSVFEYYFELYLVNNLLLTLKDIFQCQKVSLEKESEIVQAILNLFYESKGFTSELSIDNLIQFLTHLRRKIDIEIVNAPFKRSLNYDDVKILFSPGDLIFGIPKICTEYISLLKEVKFIYILDEYETLYEWQKVFINTIVWDKKRPCTFWIGARKYGYTTRMTKTGELIKPGSEFQPIELDTLIRKNAVIYTRFVEALYLKRLQKFYLAKGIIWTDTELKKNFVAKFERYSDSKLIDEVMEASKKKEFKHLKNLRNRLHGAMIEKSVKGLNSNTDIDYILNQIENDTNNNPLYQKYKIHYLYHNWSINYGKIDDLKKLANCGSKLFKEFIKIKDDGDAKNRKTSRSKKKLLDVKKSKAENEFFNIEEKYKNDLLAQLTNENNIKNVCYSGIDEFIDLSWGNPRSFILTLKKIIEYSRLKGERPLDKDSKISLDSQYWGVYHTAKWFYEDAEIVGEDGKGVYKAIKRLTDLLRVYRFSDKPTETSLSSFYLKLEELSTEAQNTIKLADVHSLIIEDDFGRKAKNSGKIEKLYQLNKTIAPLWNLPISRRGTLDMTNEVAEAIFNSYLEKNFNKHYMSIKKSHSAPNFGKDKKATKPKLDSKKEAGNGINLFGDGMSQNLE